MILNRTGLVRWRRGGVIRPAVVLVLALVLTFPHATAAHSGLIGSDPVDGAVLPNQPAFVTLTYTEHVTLVDNGMQLFDAAGTVTTLRADVSGPTVQATLPEGLANGSYVLGWRVTSADGHPISGALTFSVGTKSEDPIAGPTGGDDRLIERVLGGVQGLGYIGLLATVGLVIFRGFLLTADTVPSTGMVLLARSTAALAIVAAIVTVPLTVARQQGRDLGSLVEIGDWAGDVGRDQWIALTAIAVGLVVATVSAPHQRSSTAARTLTLVALGAAIAAPSILGHTRVFNPRWLIVSSNLLHTATGAVWFGGLLGLGLVLSRSVGATREGAATASAVVIARFSTLAGLLVGILGLSGVVSGWIILDGWKPLTSTDYGRLLLVKAGIAILVVLLAAWNRFRLVPAIATETNEARRRTRLRTSVLTETALLVGVLMVTGFLVNQSPRATAAPTEVDVAPVTINFSAPLGHGTVEGTITPGTTGTNRVTFRLVDHDSQPVTPQSDPRVRLSLPTANLGPLEFIAAPTGNLGTYAVDLAVPLSGQWELSFIVRVSTFEEPIAQVVIDIP